MADPQQLDLLRQGVEAWNIWREKHPKIPLNLSGADLRQASLISANLTSADLSGADLKGASLTSADLSGADLSGADLYGASLIEASLIGADLSGADLSEAILIGADLSGADLGGAILIGAVLSGADLIKAILIGAVLSGADLSGANLSYANLSYANLNETNLIGADLSDTITGRTIFAGIDLRKVKGLEKVIHDGPSTIGTDTLLRSQGDIPEKFLREAGLTDTFITYVRSLVQSPIEYYTCFLSVRLVSPKPAKVGGWAGKEYSFHN